MVSCYIHIHVIFHHNAFEYRRDTQFCIALRSTGKNAFVEAKRIKGKKYHCALTAIWWIDLYESTDLLAPSSARLIKEVLITNIYLASFSHTNKLHILAFHIVILSYLL